MHAHDEMPTFGTEDACLASNELCFSRAQARAAASILMSCLTRAPYTRITHIHIECTLSRAEHVFMRAAAHMRWAPAIHTLVLQGSIREPEKQTQKQTDTDTDNNNNNNNTDTDTDTDTVSANTRSSWLAAVNAPSLHRLWMHGLKVEPTHDIHAWITHIATHLPHVTHLSLPSIRDTIIDLHHVVQQLPHLHAFGLPISHIHW